MRAAIQESIISVNGHYYHTFNLVILYQQNFSYKIVTTDSENLDIIKCHDCTDSVMVNIPTYHASVASLKPAQDKILCYINCCSKLSLSKLLLCLDVICVCYLCL